MKLSLYELYRIKEAMVSENLYKDKMYNSLCERISNLENLIEDTSATGGPASTGMGAVVSAQSSSIPGQNLGPNWASNGGTEGSGDISVPYNPSGNNRVFQKISKPMGMNHGSRTGKKSREKKLDMKSIQKILKTKKTDNNVSKSRVMSFDDFMNNDITKIKK
jgi:hypothetical protein